MSAVEGWENKMLIDLAYFINGYAFKPDDWSKEGLPIIRIEQLKNTDSISDYYAGKLPDRNIINNDDLIFSWSASLFLKIWKHGKAALNQHLFKVIEKQGFDRLFIKYLIEFYLPELAKSAHGSTMQHITRKELERFNVFVPLSFDEQTKIASILSGIDTAIEQTEAVIAKQQRIKAGLMQDLLSKGIDEYGNIRSEHTHAFKDSPLGRIPVEWEVSQISQLIDLQVGYAFKSKDFKDDGILLLRGENVGHGGLNWGDKQYLVLNSADDFKDYQLKESDLVISMDRTFTKQGCKISLIKKDDLPCLLVQRVGRFLFKNSNSDFIKLILTSGKYQNDLLLLQKGMDIPHLSKEEILSPHVPILKEWEQKLIVEYIYGLNKTMPLEKQILSKLKRQKTALMQDLLSGKVRVNQLIQ